MTRYTTESIYVLDEDTIILRGDGPHGPEETAAHAQRASACLEACDGYENPADMRREAWLFRHGWTWTANENGDLWIAAPGEWLHVKQPHHVDFDRELGWDTPGARAAVDALIGGGE